MAFREAFAELMHFGRPELLLSVRVGYWPATLERWRGEGLPGGVEPWSTSGSPVRTRAGQHGAAPRIRRRRSCAMKVRPTSSRQTDGVVSAREGRAFDAAVARVPVKTRQDFEGLLERLTPTRPVAIRRLGDPRWGVEDARSLLTPGACMVSFFGWPRMLDGASRTFSSPTTTTRTSSTSICQYHLDLPADDHGAGAQEVEFDFAYILGGHGLQRRPLISPQMVREFMLPLLPHELLTSCAATGST